MLPVSSLDVGKIGKKESVFTRKIVFEKV